MTAVGDGLQNIQFGQISMTANFVKDVYKRQVLDEPTAMLDPNGRKSVIKTARKLNREEGITIILITHYMEEVIEADHIFVMDDGKVVMQGNPKEIFSQVDELKRLRLDVPQATLLAWELKKRGIDLPDGILRNEELVDELWRLK